MKLNRGLLLLGEDRAIMAQARAHELPVLVRDEPRVPWDKTLIVTPGTPVPWDLLPAAWHFLRRWDAAVPLWRYGPTAESIGEQAEREYTRAIVRDLRVLLYNYELLFVRKNVYGETLVATWVEECRGGRNRRLAFLRAVYRIKPRLCVLPRSWVVEARTGAKQRASPKILTKGTVSMMPRNVLYWARMRNRDLR